MSDPVTADLIRSHRNSRNVASIIAGNRFSVTVHGDGVDMDYLTNALSQVDLGKLGTLASAN